MNGARRTVLAHEVQASCTIRVRLMGGSAEQSGQPPSNQRKTPGLQDMARFLLSRK
jgi:hypothetical protein